MLSDRLASLFYCSTSATYSDFTVSWILDVVTTLEQEVNSLKFENKVLQSELKVVKQEIVNMCKTEKKDAS